MIKNYDKGRFGESDIELKVKISKNSWVGRRSNKDQIAWYKLQEILSLGGFREEGEWLEEAVHSKEDTDFISKSIWTWNVRGL